MKYLISTIITGFLFATLASGDDQFEVTILHERRIVTFQVEFPPEIRISETAFLSVVDGPSQDPEFVDPLQPKVSHPHGLPQNFALRGTSREIEQNRFRISIVLPPEEISVKFIVFDRDEVIVSQVGRL